MQCVAVFGIVLQSLVASSCSTHTTQAQGGADQCRGSGKGGHQRKTHCNTQQHSAIHGNTLQHTATHCSKLDRTATRCNTSAGDLVRMVIIKKHCNTLQDIAIHGNMLQHAATPVPGMWSGSLDVKEQYTTTTHRNILQHTEVHCNTLQHTATRCNTSVGDLVRIVIKEQHTATHCNPLQPTATHCNPLQHTAIPVPGIWSGSSSKSCRKRSRRALE